MREKINPYKDKMPKEAKQGCGCLIAIVILIAVFWATCDSKSNTEAGESGKFDSSLYVDGATLVAEDAVKSLLKAPSTASFLNERVRYFGDSTYSIDGDVDAQNAFGVMIRTGWRVDLKYNKDKEFDIISKNLRE